MENITELVRCQRKEINEDDMKKLALHMKKIDLGFVSMVELSVRTGGFKPHGQQ